MAKHPPSVATIGYIFGAIVGGIAGWSFCMLLPLPWPYLFLAIPIGFIVGSFYPGIAFAMLFASSAGDKTPQERLVRIIHSLAFLVGPLVGIASGYSWGLWGIIIGAVGGGIVFLVGAMVLSNTLNLPHPQMSNSDRSLPIHAPRQKKSPKASRAQRKH